MCVALAGTVQLVEHLPWLLHLQLLCGCPEPDHAAGQVRALSATAQARTSCPARLQLFDVNCLIGSSSSMLLQCP